MCEEILDKSRIEKMIALGIYSNDMISKVQNFSSSGMNVSKVDMNDTDKEKSIEAKSQRQSLYESRELKPLDKGEWDGGAHRKGGFRPISNSKFKWREMGERRDQIHTTVKKPRNESSRDFGPIIDCDERDDRNSGNSNDRNFRSKRDSDFRYKSDNDFRSKPDNDLRPKSDTVIRKSDTDIRRSDTDIRRTDTDIRRTDTDIRKSDTDSRLRDVDSRPKQSTTDSNADDLSHITPTADDNDPKDSVIDEELESNPFFDQRVNYRGNQNSRKAQNKPNIFYNNQQKKVVRTETIGNIEEFIRDCNTRETQPKSSFGYDDDIDDFIKQCEMRLTGSGRRGRGGGRGQPTDRNSNQRQDNRGGFSGNPSENRPSNSSFTDNRRETYRSDVQRSEMDSNRSDGDPNPSRHVKVLKETVEDMSKSNLYCKYCECHLKSLVEVNTHIATPLHQQNMAKTELKDKNIKIIPTSPVVQNDSCSSTSTPYVSEAVAETPKGMDILVKHISDAKPITLKTLTDMESYEINNDREATLAKELAKLLTNELLNYKMNLMPESVKEALKHQGIGIIDNQ